MTHYSTMASRSMLETRCGAESESESGVPKPWCGLWRVFKVLSDVTYSTEEERLKPRKH